MMVSPCVPPEFQAQQVDSWIGLREQLRPESPMYPHVKNGRNTMVFPVNKFSLNDQSNDAAMCLDGIIHLRW